MTKMTFSELLTPAHVEQVHAASLEILESVGMLVRNEDARLVLERHGCRVDAETLVAKFPRKVVQECLRSAPPSFTFYARDPDYDITVPDDRPLIMTASSAPNLIDPLTGHERRATSEDIARIAHLINALPGYDVFSVPTLADDAPTGHFSLARYYPALKNTVKPVRGNMPTVEQAHQIIRVGEIAAGSPEAYRAHPFVTHHYCPCVSPLTLDWDSTALMLEMCRLDLPSYGSVVPNGGLTSPLTLIGTLAQMNAEFLAYLTLTQLARPGKAVIYSSLPVITDMRTGAYAPGAIETGMLHMGAAQLARYYNVPCGGYVGLTNSKVNDAQSGYEVGMSAVAGLLGGVDVFNVGGLLDALMTFDFAKAVIDGEVGMMLKRIARGFEEPVGDDLALDLIAAVGPAGMFAATEHTVARMKTTAFLPAVADRDMRQLWEQNGSPDSHAHAMKRVRDILTRDNPAAFSPEVDARIRAEFTGLVAGDSAPPPEWAGAAPASAGTPSQRRGRRRRRRSAV